MRIAKRDPHRQIKQMHLQHAQFNWTRVQQTGYNATSKNKS